MKRTFAIGIGLALSAGTLCSQSTTPPKAVVEEFVSIETEGGRLTLDGWREASVLFVRSSPFVQHPAIAVIGNKFLVWDPIVPASGKKTEALIDVELDPRGQIDALLRFTPPTRRFLKSSRHFELVLTDKRWRLGPKGDLHRELLGPSRWLITDSNEVVMLTLRAAICYVSDQRDKATDPTIRKNADLTLAKLKALH